LNGTDSITAKPPPERGHSCPQLFQSLNDCDAINAIPHSDAAADRNVRAPAAVCECEGADRQAILDLLNRSFDHYADQIPMPYEIDAAIEGRQVLAIKADGALAALLFFETQGFTSTVRYWVVVDEFQSRGFGSALIRHYFAAQSAVRRFILWVTIDNENAVQKYRHYGYAPDGLADHVLVNSMIPV
jgi:ribosomal protein S18 acetylase RimI-like enzyme